MNKLPSFASLVVAVATLATLATLAACATGTTTDSVTGDISLTEADAAIDASGSRLPPRSDAGSADPDGASSADDAGTDAALDAAVDAADAAVMPDSSTTSGACGAGFVEVGQYATWSGKVNVHRPTAGAWSVDTDCTSGANVNTVSYCQKFWPTTTKQVQLGAVTSDTKPFTSGGGVSPSCGGVAPPGYPGQNQFACCTP